MVFTEIFTEEQKAFIKILYLIEA